MMMTIVSRLFQCRHYLLFNLSFTKRATTSIFYNSSFWLILTYCFATHNLISSFCSRPPQPIAEMTLARQSLSSFRLIPTITSALRSKPTHVPYTSLRMESGKVKTPVSSDLKHDKDVTNHTEGAMASLKGTPEKQDANSFESQQNLTEKEKKTNNQNAQANDSKEGMGGETDSFAKSGRSHKV